MNFQALDECLRLLKPRSEGRRVEEADPGLFQSCGLGTTATAGHGCGLGLFGAGGKQ